MFSIFSTIVPLFFNWPVAIAVLLIAAAAAGIFFIEGLPVLIEDALNPRYWLIVAGIIGLVAFINAGHTIQKQQQEAVVQKQQNTAVTDSQAVVSDVVKKKEDNSTKAHKVQQAIAAAPVGSQEDAVWDEIAGQQADTSNSAPAK